VLETPNKLQKFFGCVQDVVVTRPFKNTQVEPTVKEDVSDIGGGPLLHLCATKCVTKVNLENEHYSCGETINIKIHCNNTECDKKVNHYKVVLRRLVMMQDQKIKQDLVQR